MREVRVDVDVQNKVNDKPNSTIAFFRLRPEEGTVDVSVAGQDCFSIPVSELLSLANVLMSAHRESKGCD